MSTQQPEALRLIDHLNNEWPEDWDGSALRHELRRLHDINAELVEVLRSTGLFLHHCWCDVHMNDYSFEKMNQLMTAIDAAIAKAKGEA